MSNSDSTSSPSRKRLICGSGFPAAHGWGWLWWLAPLVLLVVPISMAVRFYCQVPVADDWTVVGHPYLASLESGNWRDFIRSPGTDSRHDVFHLVVLVIIKLTGWNLLVQALVGVSIVGGSMALLLRWLAQGPAAVAPWVRWLAGWLIVALYLTPWQWMNWTWGVQICYHLSVFFCLATATACRAAWRDTRWLAAAGIGATAATFSYINGVLAWGMIVITVGALALRPGGAPRGLWRYSGLAMVCLAGTAWSFFTGGSPVANAAERGLVERVSEAPWQAAKFTLSLLGAPFAEPWREMRRQEQIDHLFRWSLIHGIVIAVAAAVVSVRLWQARRQLHVPDIWGWLCVAVFGAGSTVMIGLGRFDVSFISPFECRYAAFTLAAAMAVLGAGLGMPGRWWRLGWAVVGVWLAAGMLRGVRPGWRDAQRLSTQHRVMEAAVSLRHVAPEPLLLDAVMPGADERLISTLDRCEALGLLHVPTWRDSSFPAHPPDEQAPWIGQLVGGETVEGGVRIEGWAMDRQRTRTPPAVVISGQAAGTDERWVGVIAHWQRATRRREARRSKVPEGRIKWEYAPIQPDDRNLFSRPPAHLHRIPLPSGEVTFRAYVYEPNSLRFTRLPGEVTLNLP